VPEHGRDYTYELHDQACAKAAAEGRPSPAVEDLTWTPEDFAVIARRQTALENDAARAGSPLLVCDTDALATRVWERRYVGPGSSAARDAEPVLPPRAVYLLTDHVGVPFVQDGWRDGEHVRAAMTGWFVDELVASGQSWALLTGSHEERLDLAVRITDAALDRAARFGTPP
jgi:nicotinamide riboside kinase